MSDTSVIIVAAGSSTRMNGIDKQFAKINNMPVIARSIKAFEECPDVFEIIIAARKEATDKIENLCRHYNFSKVKKVVCGGSTRAQSVKNAFEFVDEYASLVAVHDGARPLVKNNDIMRVLSNARKFGASALGVPVKDTIKITDNGFITDTPDRNTLFAAQTPQVFKYSVYKEAIYNMDESVTDDCMAVEKIGQRVYITVGSYDNIKITTPEDLVIASAVFKEDEE